MRSGSGGQEGMYGRRRQGVDRTRGAKVHSRGAGAEPVKLVVGVELRGRGDVQHFRLEMPEIKVTKGPAGDARLRVDMRREFFNVMAREAKVADWIEAFTYGQAKASGPEQFLKLIVNVVERQQERLRTRRARS